MTEEEKAKYFKDVLKDVLPIGIYNMGNTCYLNSSLQIMKKIPELRKSIEEYNSMTNNPRDSLIKEMNLLFRNMDNLGKPMEPQMFLASFFNLFPMFAEKTKDQKAFQQQDADECFQMILQEMGMVLRTNTSNPNRIEEEQPIIQIQEEVQEEVQQENLIHSLFRIRMAVNFQNMENPVDKSVAPPEYVNKLTCIIANQTPAINYVNDGVSASLVATVEKQSTITGENAIFEKRMKMENLPPYLILQKIRFVWKEADEGTNSQARKAKIFKKVTFPHDLDVIEFASSELQEKIKPIRRQEVERDLANKDKEKDLYEQFKKQYEEKEIDTYKLHKMFKQEREKVIESEFDSQLWSKMDITKATGRYRLFGVITHKGRSSESGHYMSWVHHKGDSWMKFDDDYVTKVKSDEILNLCGGGDWHTAYYLVYRRLHL